MKMKMKNPIKVEVFKKFRGFESFNFVKSTGDLIKFTLSDIAQVTRSEVWMHNNKIISGQCWISKYE